MKDSRAKGGFSHISAVGRNAPAGLISLSLVIVISNERALGILYNLYRLGSFFFFFFVFSLDFLVVSIIVAIAMDNLQGCCHHAMNNSLDWSKRKHSFPIAPRTFGCVDVFLPIEILTPGKEKIQNESPTAHTAEGVKPRKSEIKTS